MGCPALPGGEWPAERRLLGCDCLSDGGRGSGRGGVAVGEPVGDGFDGVVGGKDGGGDPCPASSAGLPHQRDGLSVLHDRVNEAVELLRRSAVEQRAGEADDVGPGERFALGQRSARPDQLGCELGALAVGQGA